jgi:8-oxo-dGTP pyrophosphatase MutT (NUDIX family)
MTTSRSDAPVIRIAAAVIVDREGRILLVRKRGTEAFMQPGGKIGSGEEPAAALARELREELGCGALSNPRALGRFIAAAAHEPGCTIEAELFAIDVDEPIVPAAEIEEAIWYDRAAQPDLPLAPLTRDYVLPLVEAGHA